MDRKLALFVLATYLMIGPFHETYSEQSSQKKRNLEISMYNSLEDKMEAFELVIEDKDDLSKQKQTEEGTMYLKTGQPLISLMCPYHFSGHKNDTLAIILHHGEDLSCKIFNARMAGYKGIVLVRMDFFSLVNPEESNLWGRKSDFKVYYVDLEDGVRLLHCARNGDFRCKIKAKATGIDIDDDSFSFITEFLDIFFILMTVSTFAFIMAHLVMLISTCVWVYVSSVENEEDADSDSGNDSDSDSLESEVDDSDESAINSGSDVNGNYSDNDSDWETLSEGENEERPLPDIIEYYRLYY